MIGSVLQSLKFYNAGGLAPEDCCPFSAVSPLGGNELPSFNNSLVWPTDVHAKCAPNLRPPCLPLLPCTGSSQNHPLAWLMPGISVFPALAMVQNNGDDAKSLVGGL